jgi:hypothetical protein
MKAEDIGEAITPEMIAAGNDALAAFWTELTTRHCALDVIPDAVAAIYRAMETVRVRHQA